MSICERTFTVPLDHGRPDGPQLEVFAREVADPDGAARPYLVFFQGGPGFEAVRPIRAAATPPWLERALRDYRVLLLDQRGTGRSSPVSVRDDLAVEAWARYLTHFRADSIVRDAEHIRRELGVEQWSVLGQSFGGFCVTTYLSIAPEGLREAFITGGLPPLGRHPDEVYARTYARVLARTRRHFARYRGDERRLQELRETLAEDPVVLPGGDRLSWSRLRALGSMLGMGGGSERLHYILELAPSSPAFRHDVEHAFPFARNPLYAVLHEACYADGATTAWSAARVLPAEIAGSALLTGEHVYPWMFEECGELAPWRAVAEQLAQHEWPPLYDPAALRESQVPVAAAIYSEDIYVEREFSEETAGTIAGLRHWLTNEYEHDGLSASSGHVLDRLIDLVRGRA